MAYQDWFQTWHPGEVNLRGYFRSPEELTTAEIPRHDSSAAHLLEEARHLIEDLTSYRQARSELPLSRRYEDGTEVDELHEHFPGKQRREALARYEALKRSRPGIQAEKDIDRRSWER